MKRPTNLKVGDRFRVIEGDSDFDMGEILTLEEDDGSENPFFWNAEKTVYDCMHVSKLEPYTKTIRDAQVGDVVVGNSSGFEYLVLERGKNTVLLSYANDFRNAHGSYHFDQLEERYTLKAEPEVVDDKTAEAMKLLKEAGYKISKE